MKRIQCISLTDGEKWAEEVLGKEPPYGMRYVCEDDELGLPDDIIYFNEKYEREVCEFLKKERVRFYVEEVNHE